MLDEKVTTHLNEAFKLINEELEKLSEEKNRLADEEVKTKEERIRTVDALNKVFVPYSGGVDVDEDAFNEANSLRATLNELKEKSDNIDASKKNNSKEIKEVDKKKNIIGDALKRYNQICNNKEIVKEEKKNEVVEEAPKPIIEDVYKLETPVEDTINNVVNEPVATNTPVQDDNIVEFRQVDAKPMVKSM